MVAPAELNAAIRDALRADRPETDQTIWAEYFFGRDDTMDEASRSLEFERIRAATLTQG